ncbi:MAG: rhomboid family intramembrane serine protease [Gaiellaceae bacterium MAG52_C11]|nr:rhomboid family intramembrane serine protease [Candidatus Gaiellasilicea maunaloa]
MLPLRDNVPTRSRPFVTWALILVNVLVWVLYQLPDLEGSVRELAYQPCEVVDSCVRTGEDWPLTALTSMFMHGGWEHLLGNMLFLWIFGNNIEDALGHVRYLLFYLAGGLAATALQTVVTLMTGTDAEAAIPNLGASGAVSAVLGAYLLLLPRAKVLTIIFFILREIPAIAFLGIWFLFQLVSGGASLQSPEEGGGVAFFAHVGGFVFGFLLIKLVQVRPPLRPHY